MILFVATSTCINIMRSRFLALFFLPADFCLLRCVCNAVFLERVYVKNTVRIVTDKQPRLLLVTHNKTLSIVMQIVVGIGSKGFFLFGDVSSQLMLLLLQMIVMLLLLSSER